MLLKDKIAIITGARQGIGKSIAIEMAKEGAIAIVADINENDCQKVVAEIKKNGGRAVATKMDITDQEEIKNVITKTYKEFGKIDILINNAGILEQKPFKTITRQDWQKMFAVNLEGAFLCSQEAVKYMEKQKSGRIVNITSIGGQRGGNLAVHYSASKAGLISLTRSLARIYSKDNILTNCIAPDLVLTDMSRKELETAAGREKAKSIPIGRIAQPKEIADVAVFLASEKASYITGQTINVNGGSIFNT
jgi:3-oxoacyl-[acyl-carrier protein] reductase